MPDIERRTAAVRGARADMPITLDSTDLVRAIQRVAPIADARSTVPVLACVLVRAAGGEAIIAATDSVRAVRTAVDCDGNGEFLIDARAASKIAATLPTGPVELAHDPAKSTVAIKAGSARFRLPTLDARDFPPLFSAGTEAVCSGDASVLVGLLRPVLHAMGSDRSRPQLAAIQLEASGGDVVAVATDGHRLALSKVAANVGTWSLLVPDLAARDLHSLASRSTSSVTITRDASYLRAQFDRTLYACRLIDESFPSWRKVVPTKTTVSVTVDRTTALAAARRAAVLAADTGALRVEVGGETLRLSSENPSAGSCGDDVKAVRSVGSGTVGLRDEYLIDALDHSTAEVVEVALSGGELDPIVVRDESGFLAVIMPMRA